MPVNLDRLLRDAEARARELRSRRTELERAATAAPAPPSWAAAFAGPDVAVIAEVKRRSPSAGAIAPDLDPVVHAAAYVAGGAVAVSVLTDPDHFGGSMDDLRAVASTVPVPVLRKDFVTDPLQIVEARAAGAAAVLLIVRALEDRQLAALVREADVWGLGTLVEVHRLDELSRALEAGATVVGVNARDLDTFAVDSHTVEEVIRAIPSDVTAIAESGIAGPQDVARVAAWGAEGILVGTAVARAADPAAKVRALCGVPRVRRVETT